MRGHLPALAVLAVGVGIVGGLYGLSLAGVEMFFLALLLAGVVYVSRVGGLRWT